MSDLNQENKNYSKKIFVLLAIFAILCSFAVLKITASITVPATIAIFLAFVFYPFLRKLHKYRIPWLLGILIILVVFVAVAAFVIKLLSSSFTRVIAAFPKYESRFTAVYAYFADRFSLPYDENSSLITNLWNSLNLRNLVQNFALSLSSNVINFAKIIMLIMLFFTFLLAELKTISSKMHHAFPKRDSRTRIVNITTNIISEVTHYISIKFFISLITGILVTFSTLVVNMDFPIIWGFVAFILNFIPTFGSIISWGLTTLFALLQFFPHWGYVVYVGIAVLFINFTLGNIIEPRWEGSDLGLSPFIILLSLSLWGYIWGFVGMILAVPLMVTIKIICEQIPELLPVAAVLGNGKKKPQHRKVKFSIKKAQTQKKEFTLEKQKNCEIQEISENK